MNISLAPEVLGTWKSLPITNTLVMSYVVLGTLIGVAYAAGRVLRMIPKHAQGTFEVLFEGAEHIMDSVTGSREMTRRFFPLVLTIFLFVLFSNLLTLVPGLGTIGIWGTHNGQAALIPFIRSSSADLNFTIAVAVGSVLGVQVLGVASIGALRYAKKFFVPLWHKPYVVGTFVGILELLAEIAKIVSFSFRLFGNVFAGEVLLTVVLFLVPYLVPLPFLALELFVGFIQATVFSMLTLVFLKMGATAHDDHHEPLVKTIVARMERKR